MEVQELRVRIPKSLFKRLKIVCAEMDLSIPKQTAALIWDFVEIQEKNIEKLKEINKILL